MKTASMGWALLAAAIVKSGQDSDDEVFLKSEWCSTLTDLVSLSLSQKGCDSQLFITKRGGAFVPGSKGEIKG